MAVGGLNKNALASLLAAGGHNNYLSKTPLYGAGQAILQMPDERYETNAQAFGIPFLRGLIGQGLAGYGASQAKDKAYEAYSKNPLLADTYAANPERPAEWDADVGQIELQLALSEQEAERKAQEKAAAQMLKEEAAKEKEKARIAQALAAHSLRPKFDEAGNQIGVEVDEEMLAAKNAVLKSEQAIKEESRAAARTGSSSPAERKADMLRKEFSGLKEVQDFVQVEKAARAMAGALKDKKATSDLELVRYGILMIEPGMAVREGEQAAVMNSQSLPAQWKGEMLKAFKGESALSPETREGLRQLAVRAYDSQSKVYDRALKYYRKEAEERGLRPESVSYIGDAPTLEDVGLGLVAEASTPAAGRQPYDMPVPTPGGIPTPRGAMPTGRIDPKTGKPTYMINGVEGVL